MRGHQVYPDFVPGLLAFQDYFKSGEQRLFLVGLALFGVVFTIVYVWLGSSRVLSRFLLYKTRPPLNVICALFVGIIAARVMFIGRVDQAELVSTAICGVLFILFRFGPKLFREGWQAIVLASLFSYFGILGVILLIEILRNDGFISPSTASQVALWGAGLYTLLVIAVGAIKKSRPLSFIYIPQLLIPLLTLRYLKVTFLQGGQSFTVATSLGGSIILISLTATLLFFTFRDLLRQDSRQPPISSATLFSLALYLGYGFPPISAFSADDFHLGEMTLPWQQIVEFGQAQYSEFVSIQGILGLAIGLFNKVFFNGNLQAFLYSGTLLYAALNGVSALLLNRILGPAITLMLIPLLMPFTDRIQMALIGFLVMLQPNILRSATTWCIASACVVLTALFWNPSSGVALGAALSPAGMLMLADIYKSGGLGKVAKTLGVMATIFIIAAIILPLDGVYQFIIENGYTNTVAHASTLLGDGSINPYFPKYFEHSKTNRIAWECIRIGGWILGVCLLFALALNVHRDKKQDQYRSIFTVTLGGIFFALALFPYSMGRIDAPAYLSRAGAMSMLELAFFLPLAFALIFRRSGQIALPSLFVGFLVGIPLWEHSYSLDRVAASASAEIEVPTNFRYVKGADQGLPALGNGFITQEKLAEIESLHHVIAPMLKEGETYFDLTNRSLFYRAFNLKYPSPYPGVHAVNALIQDRIVKRLEAESPPLCFIAPMMEIDKSSAGLRSYRVYRWFILKGYRLYERAGFSFLVRPDRFEELAPDHKVTAEELDRMAQIFLHTALEKVPRAWGKSLDTLLRLVNSRDLAFARLNPIAQKKLNEGWLEVIGRPSSFDIRLEQPLDGSLADYLLLNFERSTSGKKKVPLVVFYRSEGESFDIKRSYKFDLSPGPQVVPVGADPRWLLHKVSELRFEMHGEVTGARWRLRSVKALQIK